MLKNGLFSWIAVQRQITRHTLRETLGHRHQPGVVIFCLADQQHPLIQGSILDCKR